MRSQDYFDQVAPRWDQMRASFFSEAVREKALAVARVEAGKTAADLGAGTGFLTEGLLQKGLRVIAVDQSEAMLAEMQRKFAAHHGVDYRHGEAENLPLADASVDYAFANMYLHHVESPPAAIREMARILRPGARLIVTDMDEHNFTFLREEHQDRWLGFKREDVERWLVEAGLQQVAVNAVGETCCAESRCGSQSAQVSIFLAFGVKEAPR